MSLQGLFQLQGHEHSCGRSNDSHQQRLDALMKVLTAFLADTDSLTSVKVYADRLPHTLAFLHQTELWKRYEAKWPADKEAALTAAEDTLMSAVEKLDDEDTYNCEGCQNLLGVYTTAPSIFVECLRESFEVPLRKLPADHEDCALAERALAMIQEELLTASNIAAHANEIVEN
jgi:hypothetical protein